MDDPAVGEPAKSESALSSSVLVLNKHFVPIRVVSGRRAFTLMCKNYAEAIDVVEDQFITWSMEAWLGHSLERERRPAEFDLFVQTPRMAILVPRVIRLLGYDKLPRREVKFNRRNVLARDENRCQYCGKRFSLAQLSIDHVVPKSRGGKSSWLNVVAACSPCNTRKGGRMPHEASMRLIKQPAVPKKNPLLEGKLRSRRYAIWGHFLGEGELAIDA